MIKTDYWILSSATTVLPKEMNQPPLNFACLLLCYYSTTYPYAHSVSGSSHTISDPSVEM